MSRVTYLTKFVWGKPRGVTHVSLISGAICGKAPSKCRRSSKPASRICSDCRKLCANAGVKLPED